MVGIVIVSHSARLAEGVQQIVDQMVHGRVPFALAGGTENGDEPIGTDPVRVLQAIESVYSDDGVMILMDLGSAMMSAEAAIELLPPEQQAQIYLCEAPLVEGALAAAVAAAGGAPIDRVLTEARQALPAKLAQMAPVLRPDAAASTGIDVETTTTTASSLSQELSQTFVLPNRLGLHARPAARLIGLIGGYEAVVTFSKGDRQAEASSINQLLMLGARQGDQVTVHAYGPDAAAVLAAIATFISDNVGDRDDRSMVAGMPKEQLFPQPTTERVHQALLTMDQAGVNQLHGIPASAGIALGPVIVLTTAPLRVERRPIRDVRGEQARFQRASVAVQRTLAILAQQVASRSEAEADILAAQRLMLADPDLLDRVYHTIAAEQVNAEWAWQVLIEELAAQYDTLEDEYLRGRAADVRDVGIHVLRLLTGQPPAPQPLTTPGILVADELSPSDVAALDPALVLGIVTARGGVNDHSAILARTLGIPAVVGVADALTHLSPGRLLALDGAAGLVWLDPDPATVTILTARRSAWLTERAERQRAALLPAVMRDGATITISANIGAVAEIETALVHGAAGVGLLRTELLFMAQSTLPDEETQYQIYRRVMNALDERPLVVRTLDIGGDKPLPQLPLDPESNPFLGWRGLRYCLDNPAIFRPQVRALLRCAVHGSLRIMFPMVSTVDELLAAKALLATEAAQLAADGHALAALPPIGIMIETPAAVFNGPELAHHVDFFSIGTNDLTQYLMAADRSNARVAGLVNAFQPPVLRAIAQVVQSAQRAGIGVSICGEMAADPRATALLVGLGITELSMNAPAIPQIKAQIRQLDLSLAKAIAQHALTLTSVREVEAYLSNL